MTLLISNLATAKQVAILVKLNYTGRGKYALSKLSTVDAAKLIDELWEEQRIARRDEQEQYGNLFDLLDPFNSINK